MKNALELFFNRRSRLGRGSADLELGSAPDTSHRRRHLERRSGGYSIQSSRRQGFDGCIPTRRSSLVPGYGTAFMEGVPFEFNSGTSQRIPTTSVAAEGESGSSNISIVTCSERLPGAVLQARERLMQRLRGAAVSDRRSRRSTSNVSRSSDIFSDDIRLVDAGDWETDIFHGGNNSSASSSIFHSEQCKKPLALCPEALNSLPVEIFSVSKGICSNETADDNHRFHHACLVQWGQVRGDCPCCRRSIT
ncbi:unnamed protein product [Rhodiola kirilowii]